MLNQKSKLKNQNFGVISGGNHDWFSACEANASVSRPCHLTGSAKIRLFAGNSPEFQRETGWTAETISREGDKVALSYLEWYEQYKRTTDYRAVPTPEADGSDFTKAITARAEIDGLVKDLAVLRPILEATIEDLKR